MLAALKSNLKRPLLGYQKRVCQSEYEAQTFTRFNERPVEFGFVFRHLSRIYPKQILDVGTGTTALPHLLRNCGFLVTAIDNIRDYWPDGMVNRHYHVIDDDITAPKITRQFDFITCVSVLEHIEAFDVAVRNMSALLRPDGHLVITVPYSEDEYVRNVYDVAGSSYGQGAPYITQAYCRENVRAWQEACSLSLEDQEYWRFWQGKHWTVGEQVIPPERTSASQAHQLTCLLLKKC